MIASDRHGISIAHDHNHLQIGLGQFHPCGKGQGPTMGRVKGIKIDIHGKPSRASNPGDEDNVILLVTDSINRTDQSAQHDSDSASRTPDMGKLLVVTEIFMDQLGNFRHQDTS